MSVDLGKLHTARGRHPVVVAYERGVFRGVAIATLTFAVVEVLKLLLDADRSIVSPILLGLLACYFAYRSATVE